MRAGLRHIDMPATPRRVREALNAAHWGFDAVSMRSEARQ
jgi:hypothetical protein